MSDNIKQPKVATCLWFDDCVLEAVEFYCSLLPDSRIDRVSHYPNTPPGEAERVLTVHFTLAGTPYMALNGGPQFPHSEAASIFVTAEDQTEIDRLWKAIAADGGIEGECGWVRDRFGVWFQVAPRRLMEWLDQPQYAKVWPKLMKMKKIDLSVLEAAAKS